MDKAKIIKISDNLELDYGGYRFVIWDAENQITIKIFGIGEWTDWNKFVSKARSYIDEYQAYESYDFDEEPPEGSPERNVSLLIGITTIKPHFVEQAEKVIERNKKGPVVVFFYNVLERFIWPLVGFGLWGRSGFQASEIFCKPGLKRIT